MLSARPNRSAVPAIALAGALSVGCASLLGIDQDYTLEQQEQRHAGGAGGKSAGGADASTATGGTSGGAAATGGRGTGTGGTANTGGLPGPGDDCSPACAAGEKCCGGVCVPLSPLWGCYPDRCGSCPDLPDNALGACEGEICSFVCLPNFEKTGQKCIASGTGGAGGKHDSGSPVPPPVCSPATCTGCAPPIYSPCCQGDGTCGCAFPGAPCFPKPP